MKFSFAKLGKIFTILGVYEFLVYCHFVKIPFPVDAYSGGAAIILGILSFFAALTLILYVNLPAVLPFFLINPKVLRKVALSKLFGRDVNIASSGSPADDMHKRHVHLFIRNYIFVSCIPSFVLVLANFLDSLAVFFIGFFCFLVSPLGFGLSYFRQADEGRVLLRKRFLLYLGVFGYQFYFFFGLILFSGLATKVFITHKGLSAGLAIVIFVVVNGWCLFPLRPNNYYESVAEKYQASSVFRRAILANPALFFVVLISVMLLLFLPQTSFKVVRASMNFLSLGGNVERRYYFSVDDAGEIADVLVDKSLAETNVKYTKNLYVVLDVGNTLVVSLGVDEDNRVVYSLPKDKMHYNIELKETERKRPNEM